jgi:hypothetical protein
VTDVRQLTVRERVQEVGLEMLTSQPTPAQLSAFEISLAGLLWRINEEVTEADIEFRQAVMKADAKSAAGKKQIAEAGPEFRRLLEAKATYDSCHQMLMTCRNTVRRATEEMRLQR